MAWRGTVAFAALTGLLALGGCSELATEGGEGADCVRSSQCQPGLACVPVAPDASQRMCSGDPGNLMGEVPEADGSLDGGMVVADSGPGTDSGPTGMDSGPSGTDSGPMGTDSGPMGTDSGPTGMDSGPADSGSGSSDAATD